MKKSLIVWVVLLAAGFAAGFMLQFRGRLQLESQLAEMKASSDMMQSNSRLTELRDSISMTYVEATRLNYSIAGEHSSRFFDLARKLAAREGSADLKPALQEILSSRDAITGALAKGDSSAMEQLRNLLILTFRSTGALK